ncbi:MAG: hypothetical protein ACYDFT_03510 [Thermoplasmata archaeon]
MGEVTGGSGGSRALSLLTLRRSRQMLRAPFARLLAGTIAIVYLLLALLVGKMLELAPTAERSTTVLVLTSGGSWWNFPALVVVAPNATLILPYFSTLAMIVVTAGVSLGMTVAVLLGIRLARERSRSAGRSAAVSSTAGLTPVLIALVTLGACCSTTAAATAGIGLAAQSTGTTISAVLAANWYLGVFQMVVLFVALIAQEQLVEIYALFRAGEHPAGAPVPMVPPPISARSIVGGILRLGLVIGGVSWALAVVAAWTSTDPWSASGATWADWILLHGVVASFAIAMGLFPRGTQDLLVGPGRAALVARALLAGSGILLLAYLPAAAAQEGLYGLGNVLLGALGVPTSAGGVALALPVGVALALELGVQFVLLGLMAVAAGLYPRTVLAPLVAAGPQPILPEPTDHRRASRMESPEPAPSTASLSE